MNPRALRRYVLACPPYRPDRDPEMPSTLLLPVLNWARKLRFPILFKITAALFAVTLVIPDPIPFLDELLLGMTTIVLANWKHRKDPAVIDSTTTQQ